MLDREKLSSLSVEEVSQRIYTCIKWIADDVDDYVGGEPQIIVLKDNDPKVFSVNVEREKCEKFIDGIKKKLRDFSFGEI